METIDTPLPQHTTAGWISVIVGLIPLFLKLYAGSIAVLFLDINDYASINIAKIERTKLLLWLLPSIVLVFIGINLGIESKTTIAKIGLALNILIGIFLIIGGFELWVWGFHF